MVSLTVTRKPFCILLSETASDAISPLVVLTQSPVAFAMSSPTFLGDKPRGPILGARAEEAPTSPPVARRWLRTCVSWTEQSWDRLLEYQHDLDLVGVELGS